MRESLEILVSLVIRRKVSVRRSLLVLMVILIPYVEEYRKTLTLLQEIKKIKILF